MKKKKRKGIRLGEFYSELMKTRFGQKVKQSKKIYSRKKLNQLIGFNY